MSRRPTSAPSLAGQVAVVTGAARGIGRAIAQRLAADGATVVCADIDAELVAEAAGELRGADLRGQAQACDVASPADVERLMAAAEALGGPHVVVCNAATDFVGTIDQTSVEDWARVLSINLTGVFLCVRAALPRMRRLGGGSIINIASVNAFWLEPELAAYATAKGGVLALTRSVAIDAGRDGIRCNCVCPGYIDTGMAQRYFDLQPDPARARTEAGRMHALGRVGAPAEVAAMVAFLAGDEASFCTAQSFVVDGGLSAGIPAGPAEPLSRPPAAG